MLGSPVYSLRAAAYSSRIVGLASLLLFLAFTAYAEDDLRISRVEEDWELVLSAPADDINSPQVTCAMAPTGDADSLLVALELNHATVPAYQAGGVHTQLWAGGQHVASRDACVGHTLGENSEVVAWTQSLEVADGALLYRVDGGGSTSWPNFGSNALHLTIETDTPSLDAYNPVHSVSQSGVSFGGNRVHSLTLREVRLHFSNGDMLRLTDPTVIHSQQ